MWLATSKGEKKCSGVECFVYLGITLFLKEHKISREVIQRLRGYMRRKLDNIGVRNIFPLRTF